MRVTEEEVGLGEPARKKLNDDYPGWHVWRNGSLAQAGRRNTSPPPDPLRARDWKNLRAQLEVFEAVYAEHRDMRRALAAARVLEN